MNLPSWWEWELGFTAHVEGRMEERGFSEIELLTMLDNPTKFVPAHHPGRWVIHTRHAGQSWRVVVEPDPDDQILMIVTAYPEEVRP